MGDLRGFYEENKSSCIGFVIVTILCICGLWLVHDYYRNEPTYNDTDSNLERIEERITGIERRLDTIQNRLEQTQKTVTGISERINTSAELAGEVASGIGVTEERLESAIQRSGRIANIIQEVERTNK